ncbi:MAG: hypothetical protein ACT4OJ_07810 [Bacteroidota bacterium]
MKKMMLTLAITISSFGAAFAGSVSGRPLTSEGEEEVNARVLYAFKKEFNAAKDIKWTVAQNYYLASFLYNDQHISAYYSTEGELMGMTRYISPADLPLALQSDLKKNYKDYWVSDLFEVANSDGTAYYITLEDAETKLVLKATNGKSWNSYKKVKKS